MKELNLRLQLPVLVPPDRAVRAHADYILESGIDGDALHHLLVAVERLNLAELALGSSTPQYARAVHGARGKAAGVASPANVNDVSHVPSKLPGVAPLHSLL